MPRHKKSAEENAALRLLDKHIARTRAAKERHERRLAALLRERARCEVAELDYEALLAVCHPTEVQFGILDPTAIWPGIRGIWQDVPPEVAAQLKVLAGRSSILTIGDYKLSIVVYNADPDQIFEIDWSPENRADVPAAKGWAAFFQSYPKYVPEYAKLFHDITSGCALAARLSGDPAPEGG